MYVWAFDMLLQKAEEQLRIADCGSRIENSKDPKQKFAIDNPQSAIERAVVLYRGHFLQADARQPWTISMRERLRNKFLDAVVRVGTYWEQKGRFAKAIEWFRKGLAVDEFAEPLYQYLMVCHQKMGQEAEAVAVYKRCRIMLSQSLGVGPSTKTEEIYDAIREKK